jgi:hypothetical protein
MYVFIALDFSCFFGCPLFSLDCGIYTYLCCMWQIMRLQNINEEVDNDLILMHRYGEPERGEWMGADKNSSRRRCRLQQDENGFQHTSPTYYLSWPSPRSHWSDTRPRNQLSTSQTWECSGTKNSSRTDQHCLGRWAPPVRPVPTGETWRLPQNSPYTGQAGVAQR